MLVKSLAVLMTMAAIGLHAQTETVLSASRVGHTLVLNQVYLNGQGPFRMMIDTGNESSLVRPDVARRLRLRPAYAVERATASGIQKVPAVVLDEVRAGEAVDRGVEAMIASVNWGDVDGVLGQSWLIHHDYLLDYRRHRLVLEGPPPGGGVRVGLRSAGSRPAISAEVDGRTQDLVLDSGASDLVLFERRTADFIPAHGAQLLTNSGSIPALEGSARVNIGGAYRRSLAAVRVASAGNGLLPASEFAAVFVSNRQGIVVLGQ